MGKTDTLFTPLRLPCGATLKNRIVKSAMSDSLGDGRGGATPEQGRLYRRWANGGLALAIVGEVQGQPGFAEKPGNLVLDDASHMARFRDLAAAGSVNGAALWLQLGHAGALAYPATSAPMGPSALTLPGLQCTTMPADMVRRLPEDFARTARLARQAGFGGVQVHAAHGFLLSQFLSPLFNRRDDAYGGPIGNRMTPLLDTIAAVRAGVGPDFPVGVKLNSSDMLQGGLTEAQALRVVVALDRTSVDLLNISGGTYFPGAKSSGDSSGKGPYFIEFAARARALTDTPIMLTGGFKTRQQAVAAVAGGVVDAVGMARALVLDPDLPRHWQAGKNPNPAFPRFADAPEGGVTAWYTLQITDIGAGRPPGTWDSLADALTAYQARDNSRAALWRDHFGAP